MRPTYHQSDLEARAWDIQSKWHDSLAEVQVGYAAGPFHSRRAVNRGVGNEPLGPMPRFAVVQSDKVRDVDGALDTGSEAT